MTCPRCLQDTVRRGVCLNCDWREDGGAGLAYDAFTRPRLSERHGLIVLTLCVVVCLILLALIPASGLEAGSGAHSGSQTVVTR